MLFLIALAITLILLLPMRLALGWVVLDAHGIAASGVRGSVWNATIEQMRVGALPLGTLDAALSPLPLLVGRIRLDLARHGGIDGDLTGAITLGRADIAIDDLTGTIPVAALFAPLPIAALELDQMHVHFVGHRCTEADGRVRARLAGTIPDIALSQGLSGALRCDGGQARMALTSQSGREHLDVTIDARGRYVADIRIVDPDPTIAPALVESGFTSVAGGYRRHVAGGIE
ncbi:MAG TPA: type II secretion system protein N [Sphingomonas sp.]|nr:type II secretion system protein N [Sphingomonas sp.]